MTETENPASNDSIARSISSALASDATTTMSPKETGERRLNDPWIGIAELARRRSTCTAASLPAATAAAEAIRARGEAETALAHSEATLLEERRLVEATRRELVNVREEAVSEAEVAVALGKHRLGEEGEETKGHARSHLGGCGVSRTRGVSA